MNRSIRIKNIIFKIIPFVLLIIFFSMSYLNYIAMKNSAFVKFHTEFSLRAKEVKALLEARMLTYENVLNGTRGLFESSAFVTRSEFKIYVNALKLNVMFPGIQGVGYSAIIPSNQKDNFIKKVRAEGFDSFDIVPTTPRDFYTAIIYLEPFDERNQRAFGYDMLSEPVRREAMQSSRDKNMAVISGKVTLLQEHKNERQSGFLMYLPIFDKNMKIQTLDERKKHIRGWVYAPFRVNDFMHGLDTKRDIDIDIEIFDNGVIDKKSLMYDSYINKEIPLCEEKININVAGHDWAIFIKSTPAFEKKLDLDKANLVLLLGVIFSIFLAFIVWQLVNIKEYAQKKTKRANNKLLVSKNKLNNLNKTLEKRVEEKTLELQMSNKRQEEYILGLEMLNEELRKSKEDALQAAQAKSNFISSISHELRTPLNAIINFTDQTIEDFEIMLVDRDLQSDTKSYLQRVLVNSRHLLQLINDLLEFTKAEAGKIDYKLEENDINTILKSAYNNTYSLLNGTDVRFTLKLSETALVAMVDSRRFLQILLNLLSNAIKFTQKGFIELRSFNEGENIIVEIEDTGKGIPLEKQKAIFEPFVQVDSTDSGTGLGLGLVKKMCDNMDIGIWLNSVEQKGATFRLIIKTAERR